MDERTGPKKAKTFEIDKKKAEQGDSLPLASPVAVADSLNSPLAASRPGCSTRSPPAPSVRSDKTAPPHAENGNENRGAKVGKVASFSLFAIEEDEKKQGQFNSSPYLGRSAGRGSGASGDAARGERRGQACGADETEGHRGGSEAGSGGGEGQLGEEKEGESESGKREPLQLFFFFPLSTPTLAATSAAALSSLPLFSFFLSVFLSSCVGFRHLRLSSRMTGNTGRIYTTFFVSSFKLSLFSHQIRSSSSSLLLPPPLFPPPLSSLENRSSRPPPPRGAAGGGAGTEKAALEP